MKHPIPDEVLTDHLAVLAKTGAGKTYLAKGLVERLLEQKRRVCIVDPKNAWWGLKSSADGKSPGFQIIVFGGPNADVPLLAAHGKVLGEAVATTHLSCIICTKGMPERERIQFLTDFFQTLDMKNSEPLHLVLDEAHMMAPQKPLGEMQRLTHWTSELVSGGRGMGFRIILLSQRPARLNKDVLTQCESLVAMRMTGPQDRDAVRNWIHDQADIDKGKEIVASLPTLPNGEGWFWAPARDILKRVKFPLITTYDNSKTKRDSKVDAKAALAPVDLSALEEKLGKVKIEIDANDPKKLKTRIAELEKSAAKGVDTDAGKQSASDHDLVRAYEEGFALGKKDGFRVGAEAMNNVWNQWRKGMPELIERACAQVLDLRSLVTMIPPIIPEPLNSGKSAPRFSPSIISRPEHVAAQSRHTAEMRSALDDIARPQQRVLDAVAWWMQISMTEPTYVQIAGAARYSVGGNFNNICSGLVAQGLLERRSPGTLSLTDAGVKSSNILEPPSQDELHDRVRATLNAPQIKVFDAALNNHPNMVTAEALASASGYHIGGNFNNIVSSLTSREILVRPRPGMISAAEWLFL